MGLPGASWHPVMGAEVLGPEWERVGDGTVRDVPGGGEGRERPTAAQPGVVPEWLFGAPTGPGATHPLPHWFKCG